jgi:hypothetical protein
MTTDAATIFTQEWTRNIFPPEKTDAFFEALFGGAEEGAYDIALRFVRADADSCEFAFDLIQRPGKCLVCNLTYGLPQVFARHPILDVKSVVAAAAEALGKDAVSVNWQLQPTRETSSSLHSIPLVITF